MFRAKQWVKNAFVLLPLFFSLKIHDLDIVLNAIVAVLSFCFVSSLIYILNDWNDRQVDSEHKTKKYRPFASGKFGKYHMLVGLLFCLGVLVALFMVKSLPNLFYLMAAFYVLNSISYTYFLKNIELLEMFSVALGYIIRVAAGVVAIGEVASPWILFCAGSVALSIIAFKRRAEIINTTKSHHNRIALNQYNSEFLNVVITVSSSFTVIAYALFTISDYAVSRYQADLLPCSTFFVLFGVLRFAQINMVKTPNEDPTSAVLQDVFLIAGVVCWAIFIAVVIYG